jgi:hypothetical protein
MTNKTAFRFNNAVWLNLAVGMVWMGVGLRDVFVPRLFRFDGQVAVGSTIIFEFAAAAIFLVSAFCLYQAKPTVR